MRKDEKVRASWSEEVRMKGQKVYVSTAIELVAEQDEDYNDLFTQLQEMMTDSHLRNIKTATEGLV